jgi:hypothetical protein
MPLIIRVIKLVVFTIARYRFNRFRNTAFLSKDCTIWSTMEDGFWNADDTD